MQKASQIVKTTYSDGGLDSGDLLFCRISIKIKKIHMIETAGDGNLQHDRISLSALISQKLINK